MRPVFSLVFLCTSVVMLLAHPLHVSVTEIEFDQKEKSLEIMMRIFTDDLEEAVRKKQQRKLNLLDPARTTTDALIGDYLAAHFTVKVDNRALKLEYLGHELEADAVICYIEVKNVKKWKTIEITNDIIMEVYNDQSNLVNVTFGDEVKSLRLTTDNSTGMLTF